LVLAADKWQQQPFLRQALTAPIVVISLGWKWQYQYFET